MPTSTLTLNTITGLASATTLAALFGDVFPDTVLQTAVFGGLGGMARWMAVRTIDGRKVGWTENLSWVPLGIIMAVGLDTFSAPLISYALSGAEQGGLWDYIKDAEPSRGSAFVIGLTSTVLIGWITDRMEVKKND